MCKKVPAPCVTKCNKEPAAYSWGNHVTNKAIIGNKLDDKAGAKGICLETKRCIRLGARKIKLETRSLRLEPEE